VERLGGLAYLRPAPLTKNGPESLIQGEKWGETRQRRDKADYAAENPLVNGVDGGVRNRSELNDADMSSFIKARLLARCDYEPSPLGSALRILQCAEQCFCARIHHPEGLLPAPHETEPAAPCLQVNVEPDMQRVLERWLPK